MIRKLLFLVLLTTLVGCSAKVPNYIQDNHPYKRIFYSTFDEVEEAAEQMLIKHGWTITKKSDPSVYERSKEFVDPNAKQILIFTDIRNTPFLFGVRYARINVYLRSQSYNAIELEIRFVKVTTFPLKAFTQYRSDKYVDQLFGYLEKSLD